MFDLTTIQLRNEQSMRQAVQNAVGADVKVTAESIVSECKNMAEWLNVKPIDWLGFLAESQEASLSQRIQAGWKNPHEEPYLRRKAKSV